MNGKILGMIIKNYDDDGNNNQDINNKERGAKETDGSE